MSDIRRARDAVVARILEGEGTAPRSHRRAAFDNAMLDEPLRSLVDTVATHAHRVADQDIAAARTAGHSEDQIFELVVCAAVGQAARQYDAALSALEIAIADRREHAPRNPR